MRRSALCVPPSPESVCRNSKRDFFFFFVFCFYFLNFYFFFQPRPPPPARRAARPATSLSTSFPASLLA